MNEIQSLANQLSWCMTTKNHLNELNSEIRKVSELYTESIENLEKTYIVELLPKMRKIQREFEHSTNELIQHINDEHLEYVDSQSKKIQDILGRL